MTFPLKRYDRLQGIEAHRALGTAVVFAVAVAIAGQTCDRDTGGRRGQFRYPTGRDVDLNDSTGVHR
jgi:hypothetical protein